MKKYNIQNYIRYKQDVKISQPQNKNILDYKREELINEVKNSEIYKTIIKKFPDAELTDVKLNKKED